MARNVDSIFHTVFRTAASILRKRAGYKTTIVVVRVDLSYSFDTMYHHLQSFNTYNITLSQCQLCDRLTTN